LLRDRKDNDSRDKKTSRKKDRDKIMFGGDVQNKMIVFVSCLVMVNKTK
jgi:hypothetical protein